MVGEEGGYTLHYQQLINWIREDFKEGAELKGCEIGVDHAQMEIGLVEAFPNLYMYGIDHKIPDDLELNNPRIELIREKSDIAISRFLPETLHFVYLDGDHSCEQVMRDILNYARFIRSDGFMAGHDYVSEISNCNYGVKKAVDKILGTNSIKLGDDYAWKVNKRDIKW